MLTIASTAAALLSAPAPEIFESGSSRREERSDKAISTPAIDFTLPPDAIQSSENDFSECFVENGPVPSPEFPKRRVLTTQARKRLAQQKRDREVLKRLVSMAWLQWDRSAADATHAEDTFSIADELLATALNSELNADLSTIKASDFDWRVQASQLDTEAALGFKMARWELPMETIGRFQKTDFAQLRSRLTILKKEEASLAAAEKKASKKAEPQIVAKKAAPKKAKNAVEKTKEDFIIAAAVPAAPVEVAKPVKVVAPVVAIAPVEQPVFDARTDVAVNSVSSAPAAAETVVAEATQQAVAEATQQVVAEATEQVVASESKQSPELESNEPTLEAAPVVQAPTQVAVEAPTVAPAVAQAVPVAPSVAVTPKMASADFATGISQQIVARLTDYANRSPEKVADPEPQAATGRFKAASARRSIQSTQEEKFGTELFGRITVDRDVVDFLQSRRASLEYFLVPVQGNQRKDLIPLARFPEEQFEFDAAKLEGAYRLVALAFAPESSDHIGRAVFETEITRDNSKQNIRFNVSLRDLLAGGMKEVADRATVPVTLSIFKGASSEYRQSNPIAGAKIQIAGLPELGEFYTDENGDVLGFPEMPIHSRILLVVSAGDKFLPTTQIVSIGTRDPAERVFLIERTQAELISNLVPNATPDNRTAVVMGRVYDPSTFIPLAGQQVTLQGHDAGQLGYFGLGSDEFEPVTQSEGYFSFFKVLPGLVALNRPKTDLRTFVWRARPGTGYYVELGKLGTQSLKGQVEDFFTRSPLEQVEVNLVGDDSISSTLASGRFSIPGIEAPSGRLTMELKRVEYPIVWHTAGYNPLDRVRPRRYPMISTDDVNTILFQHRSPKWIHSTGMIIGRAFSSLFDKAGEEILEVEVRTPSGKKVPSTMGPFPVKGSQPTQGLTRDHSAFAYWNLIPGEYVVIWRRASDKKLVRIELTDTERDRVSIAM